VHRRDPAYFDFGRHGRFNPPSHLADRFGTLYLSTTPAGAFVETLGRSRYLVEADIYERRLTICKFARPLRMFRVSSRSNRFRYTELDLAHDAVATTADSRRATGIAPRPASMCGIAHSYDSRAFWEMSVRPAT